MAFELSYSTTGSVVSVNYESSVPCFGIQFDILDGRYTALFESVRNLRAYTMGYVALCIVRTGFSSSGITQPTVAGGDALAALDASGEGDESLFFFSLGGSSFGPTPGGGSLMNLEFLPEDMGKTFCVEDFIASADGGAPLPTTGALMCSTP
eukprot:scaffold6545_cov323-Prasinococcus_capsulatus_cf.AAC.1